MPVRDANSPKHTLPKLRDLYLNLEGEEAIKCFLDWLDLPGLRRLTLPRIITFHGYRPKSDPYPDLQASGIARVINSAIQTHQHTLEQVVLLNTWQSGYLSECDFINELDDDWVDGFTSQEMVFGTQPPHPVLPQAVEEQEDTQFVMREYCKLYRTAILCNQSRATLRRLRIDQIDFYEDLIAELFDELRLEDLRVIMLYPWSDSDQPHDVETHTTHTPYTYKDLNTFVEGRVALRIVTHNLPQLRILVIGGHRFWIEQSPLSSTRSPVTLQPEPSIPKLWALSEALADPHQRSEINEQIPPMDWRFLQDLPSHPSIQDPHARPSSEDPGSNCRFTSWPSLQMMKQRNYTVLLRENGPEELAPHHSSVRRLMNLPSWNSFIGERSESHWNRRPERPSDCTDLNLGNFLYFDEVKVEQVFPEHPS